MIILYYLCKRLLSSEFGLLLKAIKENELRLEGLGYNIEKYKTICFMISAMIAGYAGEFILCVWV